MSRTYSKALVQNKDLPIDGEIVEEPDFDRILTGKGGLVNYHMGDGHYADFVIEGEVVTEPRAIVGGNV